VCNKITLRELLTVKKAVFTAMGAGGKTLRSRTTAYLCNECLPKDEDYQREAFTGAPGMKSEPLERVRAAQRKAEGETEK
jgi:hypothetical protein